jgi:putative iron-only hydrogenase system regulator
MPPFSGAEEKRRSSFMEERYYIVNIIINNRVKSYRQVNELLHDFAEDIKLRVGYPLPEQNSAIILLVVKANNDVLGSLTGKLGQVPEVDVKTLPLK